MRVSIVTIGDTNHAEWYVGSANIKNGNKVHRNYFLESRDKKVMQKIKLGGNFKYYPNDKGFTPEMATSSDVITNDEISVQEMTLPFGSAFVNPKNMNPYVAGLNSDSRDRLVILLLGNDYGYLRSHINQDIGEIICTFHTQTSIACVIRVYEEGLQSTRQNNSDIINILMVDTSKDDEFHHFRINIKFDTENDECVVSRSTVKNADTVKRLSIIDNKFNNKNVVRRFVRFTPHIITSYFVFSSSMTDEEVGSVIDKHYVSEALDPSIRFLSYSVNTDENGFIINDDDFKVVIDDMAFKKIKAFTLVKCKMNRDTFEKVRPLYIFSLDETEDVTNPDDVKTIKCIKSN